MSKTCESDRIVSIENLHINRISMPKSSCSINFLYKKEILGNPRAKLGLIRARFMEIDLYLTEKRNNVVKKKDEKRGDVVVVVLGYV